MKVAVILPAAGLGTRMGKGAAEKTGTSRKQFMLLEGSPILMHTVRKFTASARVSEIVVAVRAEDVEWVGGMLSRGFPGSPVRAVEGGNSRQQSVDNALNSLAPDTDLVAVHDAVRPFIDMETIDKVLDEATETGAAIVGLPAVDTVKQVSRGTGRVLIRATLPREKLVMAHKTVVRKWADEDINVGYPIDAMRALEADGTIGRLAHTAVSIVGSIERYTELMEQTLPAVKAVYDAQGVDLVLMVPF